MRAIQKQKNAESSLRAIYNDLQPSFERLAMSWKGAGGEHFSQTSQKILEQNLIGLFMATTSITQTKAALESFSQVDENIAKSHK